MNAAIQGTVAGAEMQIVVGYTGGAELDVGEDTGASSHTSQL